MKKPTPKETITGQDISIDIYEENQYKKMDLYELSLEQFKLSQYLTEVGNRVWRLRNEEARIKKLRSRIETIKAKIFIEKGYKVVKDERKEE